MKRWRGACGLVAVIGLIYFALPSPATAPVQEVDSIRKMAAFLQSSPGVALTAAGKPRRAVANVPALPSVTDPLLPQDGPSHGLGNRGAVARAAEIERALEARYPHTELGAVLRRYVALSLAGIDTDYQPEFSRKRLLNELIKDTPHATDDVQSLLVGLAAQGPGPEGVGAYPGSPGSVEPDGEVAALNSVRTYLGPAN